ncbi:2'-5' RNA ligase family protein [Haloechinothrix sp. LS1_15]|uniref:2'-5' RNA ligase family protein n=1 Tax=Haloechinothrix sp. LS1_15 TaxID=2652248 RepID=UPI002947F3B7|nr:2'-5' RNA ligase family protein [Haloechinothrix sp. LS1_15]MDV6012475.1 2'-5' RNA ligase family protein [Haloechinothrix sp. LS1_15]
MALGVCLLFDRASERALRRLWDRLEERGIPTLRSHTHGMHYPHMSYVVLLRWDLQAVRAALDTLPDNGPFEVTFDALGSFRRGRACLVPSIPADLVRRQQAVVEATRQAGALVHKHYERDRWLPHAALAPRAQTEYLATVALAVYEVLPLTARVKRAALIDSSTGEMWPLPTLP